MTIDTAPAPRRTIESKKELALWCAAQGIALVAPITLKKGWFHLVVQLPPSHPEGASMYTFTARIGSRGLDRTPWTYEPYRYERGTSQRLPLSEEATALEDIRIARLNEIQLLVNQLRNVSMSHR